MGNMRKIFKKNKEKYKENFHYKEDCSYEKSALIWISIF